MSTALARTLQSHQSLGIFSHIRPDGDALGSQIALCLWLQNKGITVHAFNEDPFPANIAWMRPYFPVKKPDKATLEACDAYVFVDGNQPERFGELAHGLKDNGKPKYMVDHHPDPDPHYDLSLSVPGKSSTAELIYELIATDDVAAITPEMAKALYAGIMTDTGSFRFDSVTPETHKVVAALLQAGRFNPSEIHELVYDNNEFRHLELLGVVLQNIKLHADNQLATMSVTQAMLKETGCHYGDLEGFISYPLSLKSVKAAFLLSEKDGSVKMSLRSKSSIDVNKIARIFDGGGHQKAAGAWHKGPLEATEREIIEVASRHLG